MSDESARRTIEEMDEREFWLVLRRHLLGALAVIDRRLNAENANRSPRKQREHHENHV